MITKKFLKVDLDTTLLFMSQYFYTAFSNEWAEKKDGNFILRKPNISPQLFNIILRFIYSVDEFNIQPLVSHIQEFLIEHKTEFLHQNPTGILETIYQHETFADLWDFCLEIICKNPKILFNSDNFVNLKAPLLELLLKRDDLYMDEIEIWERLLKWCFAQQNIKNDPAKWNNDDITKIRRLLHRFIPLIRFYHIEHTDFFYKVYCYKDILPQDLIYDLLEFHIVPNMKPKSNVIPRKQNLKLDSIIIESKHIPLFVSWIDKKDSSYYNKEKISYDFNLLYRSNESRFDAKSFHRNCDNKGATIWIAKIQDSTQLIGGYNPLDWNGNDWKNTADSFLFSFTDGKIISTAKLGYVKDASHAVYCGNNQGPSMGGLYCYNSNSWEYDYYYFSSVYHDIGIPTRFKVEDFEVFQVIKKIN
ncbi:unnamed protein product [Rhizophagus irregularis]|nr:unnamed protein product [Rhizophagus irregularis]